MNKRNLFPTFGFAILFLVVGISACQPVDPVGEFEVLPEAAGAQPQSEQGSGSNNISARPENSETNPVLDLETADLVEKTAQSEREQWAEMAAIHQPANPDALDKLSQFSDDHWVELAAVLYPETSSPLEGLDQYSDDHWAEMEDIHQ